MNIKPAINYNYARAHMTNGGFWWNTSCRSDLTMEFVREFQDAINWYVLSKNEYFKPSEDFVDEFKDRINWNNFTRYSKSMNESFAIKFKDYIDWGVLSFQKYLSNDFIRKHADRINWKILWKYRKVDEEFLDKFNDYIIWDIVCTQQKLSIDFVKKHANEVDYSKLAGNYHFSYHWRKKFLEIWKKDTILE